MEDRVGNIVFGYLFRWSGLSIYQGNKVDAASVELAFHIYKNGEEVLLDDEPAPYTDIFFSDIFKVCFDAENGFTIQKNENIAELFCILYGFEDFSAEVLKYTFECHKPLEPDKVRKETPEENRYEAASNYAVVEEAFFRSFLCEQGKEHGFCPGMEARVTTAHIIDISGSNNKGKTTIAESKSLAYGYHFNYFGGDAFKGKIILGADVQLAIRVYCGDEEIKFSKEPSCNDIYLCDIYDISFDREKLFIIQENSEMRNCLCTFMEWDRIEAEVIGYTLDCLTPFSDEEEKFFSELIPEIVSDFPYYAEPMEVSEEEFVFFLRSHLEDFDISDNVNAQVPSVLFI